MAQKQMAAAVGGMGVDGQAKRVYASGNAKIAQLAAGGLGKPSMDLAVLQEREAEVRQAHARIGN